MGIRRCWVKWHMNNQNSQFMEWMESHQGFGSQSTPKPFVDYNPQARPRRIAKLDLRTNRFTVKWWDADTEEWRKQLELVKSVPGRLFEPKAKHWTIPNTPQCYQLLESMGYKIELPETPAQGIELPQSALIPAEPWQAPWENLELTDTYPSGLRPYQIEALRFLEYRGGRGLIGDEMGTGKTVMALAWQAMKPELRPVLIVVMTTTKVQWYRQVRRWVGPNEPITILEGRTPRKLEPWGTYVINWDILADWAGYEDHSYRFVLDGGLGDITWKMIIGDEIQAIGNSSSKRSKAFRALSKKCASVVALSGTPIRTRPAQFYPILNLIDKQTFSNQQKYLNRYCDPRHNGFAIEYKGATNMEELHTLIKPLMLRRLKSEVMKDLPPKMIEVVPVQADPGLVEKYKLIEDDFWNGVAGAGGVVEQKAIASRLQRSAYIAKEKGCISWICEFLESTDEPLVIFYWHKAVGSILQETLKGYGTTKVDGDVTGKARDGEIQRFKDRKARIFLGNIQACGVGVDGLQDACSNMVFVEYAPSPTDHAQAEDRLHRSGQTKSVNIYYLIAPGTIDEDMVEILDSRRKMITKVVDGEIPPDTDFLGELLTRRGIHK